MQEAIQSGKYDHPPRPRPEIHFLGAVVLYFADWAQLGIRLAHHTGLGTVNVSQYLATPLKGQKEEYDYLGNVDQPCVKSIFPAQF